MSAAKVGDKALYIGGVVDSDSWGRRASAPSIVVHVDDEWLTLADMARIGLASIWRVALENVRVVEAASYEVLPEPEPEWRRGDPAITSAGTALICSPRGGNPGWVDDTGDWLTAAFVRDHFGPLTRLVPEVTL